MIELNSVVSGVVTCKHKNISLRGNYSSVTSARPEKNINGKPQTLYRIQLSFREGGGKHRSTVIQRWTELTRISWFQYKNSPYKSHTVLTKGIRRIRPYHTRGARAKNQIMIMYCISFTKSDVKVQALSTRETRRASNWFHWYLLAC